MLQSLFSGASGLRAHQTQMDVIGNNIANINTVGFKSSTAQFQEALSRSLRGAIAPGVGSPGGTDPVQVGLGVGVGAISTNQTQGSLQSTSRSLDVAIEGSGFLTLTDGRGQYYTRDGSLTVDSSGTLVGSGTGFRVLGWQADPRTGKIDTSAAMSGIQLPIGQSALARQTSQVAYAGNLDSSLATGGSVSTSYNIYDSLGTPHMLTVTFTKSATPGQWNWTATSGSDSFGATGTGTITFDANGKVSAGGTGTPTLTLANPNGAAANIPLNLDFTGVTQLAGNGQSTITPKSQDGLPLGTLSGYNIDPSGIISGTFSNGMTQAIGQIALSDFTNPSGLTKTGSNLFTESANSGLPQTGPAGAGGRGRISSGYLEMSNVDLSTEFTNMIVAQRGFQANSKIITTSDEMLQDLIGLKR